MTPERWQQVKEVLDGALQVGGEERAAFLGRACQTDSSLRIEVEALLASPPEVVEEFLKSTPPRRTQLAKVVLAPWAATPSEVFNWSCVAWTTDSRKQVFSHDLGLWTQPLSPEDRIPARGQAVMA